MNHIGIMFTAAMVSVFLIVVLFVVWISFKLKEQRRQEAEAISKFQQDIEREFLSKPQLVQNDAPEQKTAEASPSSSKEQSELQTSDSSKASQAVDSFLQQQKPASTPVQGKTPKTATLIEGLISRLNEAGLFDKKEGSYPPLDPSGECVLIRLKGNKTAFLVPRFESQHFLSQALKRFDYVFVFFSDQDVIVLNKYSDFIAGHYRL